MSMDLKLFVETALTEIVGGVEAAQTTLSQTGSLACVSPRLNPSVHGEAAVFADESMGKVNHITFDVAVTVESDTSRKNGFSVNVAPLGFALGSASSSSVGTVS